MRILLLLMSFFFCNNILAEEVEIALHCGNNKKDWVKEKYNSNEGKSVNKMEPAFRFGRTS